MKKLIDMLVEMKRLEDRFGHISCFDAPEAYKRMEELADEARERAKQLAKECGCSTSAIMEVAEDVANDILDGNIRDDVNVSLLNVDYFIDEYVLSGIDEAGRNLFDSLFYWMDADMRIQWLKRNYIDGDHSIYTTRNVDCVVVIGE